MGVSLRVCLVRSVRCLVAVLCALAVALAITPVLPASAAQGSADPEDAPLLWCEDDPTSVGGGGEDPRYAAAWVPAGATLTLRAEDIWIKPSNWVGNGRGEYFYHAQLTGVDANGGQWSSMGLADVGIIWSPGPYDWVYVGSRGVGSWTNNTGVGRAVGVRTWAERTYAGDGTRYTLSTTVTGGDGGQPPSCEEEWVLASLGIQFDGGEAGDPVRTGSGNFFDTVVDVPNVGSLGDPLLERTYNAMDPNRVVDPDTGRTGVFGAGWTSWLDSSLTNVGTDRLLYRDPSGRQVYVVKDAGGGWVAPPDLRATVVEPTSAPASTGRKLVFRGGRSVEFDTDGRLIKATSAGGGNGGESVEVSRDSTTGVPTTATFSTLGQTRAELQFTDTGADGLVDLVEGPGNIRVAYSYDAQGHLTDVSVPHRAGEPAPVAESYEWAGGRVNRILTHLGAGMDPRVRVENAYDARGRVASQTQQNGDVTEFTYADLDANNRRLTTVTHTGSGSTSPASETYIYVHDEAGTLLGVTDDDGNNVGLGWQDKRLTRSVTRGGAVTEYAYDPQKRITGATLPSASTPGAAGPTESVTYCDPASDDLRVRTITDASGTVARFTYGDMSDPNYPCAGDAARPTSITEGVDTAAIAVTRYEWSQGLPVKVTDPDGVISRMKWDPARRLLLARETDPNTSVAGAQVTFHHYDAAGRLRVTRTPSGIETWYDRDAAGRVTTITGPFQAPSRGCAALSDTCAFPATTAAAAPAGAPTEQFTYRRDGRLTSYTDQNSQTWTYTETLLAGGGSRETETNPDGDTQVAVYDSAGRLATTAVGDDTVGEKATTTYNYGSMGRLASVVDPTGVRTRYRYDADSNLTQVLDEHDNNTTTTYDRLGRATSVKDAKGNTSSFAYNAIGLLTRSVDRRGSETVHTYDSLGHLLTTTDGAGGVVTRTYTAAGRLATLTDATDRTTRYTYDDAGRLVTSTAPSGAKTTFGYDSEDRLTTQTTPAGRITAATYDPAGRVLSETIPATGTTTYTYNKRGDLTTSTDATGGVITWDYDLLGQVAEVTDALGAATSFGYDSRGNRTSRTDTLGGVTRWTFNKADQLTMLSDPLNRETTYTYDDLGQLASRQDAKGRLETYGYDAVGQLTTISYPGQPTSPGSPPVVPTTTITYNGEGQRTKLTDAAGTTTWTYDAVGNLKSEDNPGDKDLRWSWDLAGRRTKITYPDGTEYRNTLTTNGYAAAVQQLVGTTWNTVASYTRDADGLVTRQREPAGRTRTWTLDPNTGLPATYRDAPTTGTGTTATDITDTTYTRDNAGRILTEATTPSGTAGTQPTRTTTYNYDDAGQLLALDRNIGDDQTYTYDVLGRRATHTTTSTSTSTTTYDYDAASQLTKRVVDGIAHDYTYDASGRRIGESWTVGTAPRSRSWTWDVRGILTAEQYTAGSGAGASVATLTRRTRSDGRLVQVDHAATGQPTQTTQMVWDDAEPVPSLIWSGQRGATNEMVAIYGADPGAGLIRTECRSTSAPAGCTGSITHDPRGSAIATAATTARVRATAYGAYGDEATGNLTVAFGYLDEVHVGSLVHLRARDYDPATGSFLSPDPLDGVEGTTTIANTYHYANNDPINLSDPTGLRPGETTCQGFLASIVCEHSELLITTASITVGFACGIAAAPAGPFAAGAAGAACGGAVHRGLIAYQAGDNPWAAALNPELLVRDALIGGVTEFGLFKIADFAAPLAGKVFGKTRVAVGDVVARVQASMPVRDEAGSASLAYLAAIGSSRRLGNALSRSGFLRLPGEHAHHIVPWRHRAAGPARSVLQRFNIDVDSASNGVFLPGYGSSPNPRGALPHLGATNTAEYIRAVNERILQRSSSREDVLRELASIRYDLLAGRMP